LKGDFLVFADPVGCCHGVDPLRVSA